jgi:hypothetical protein
MRRSLTYQEACNRLHGLRRCAGGFVACCSAHDDRTQSPSIREGEGGRVLLKCFAGCERDDILAALGADAVIGDSWHRVPRAAESCARNAGHSRRERNSAKWPEITWRVGSLVSFSSYKPRASAAISLTVAEDRYCCALGRTSELPHGSF